MKDAVHNIGRMALLVDAMHTGNLEQLALAMDDKLHQPYRMPLIKGMEELIPQAKALGALNVTISGAGPTILLVSDGEKDFSSLADLLKEKGVTAKITALHPVNKGAEMIEG
jgi:homoserine kinase